MKHCYGNRCSRGLTVFFITPWRYLSHSNIQLLNISTYFLSCSTTYPTFFSHFFTTYKLY